MKKNVVLFLGIVIVLIVVVFFFLKEEEIPKDTFQSLSITDPVVENLYQMAHPSDVSSSIFDVYRKESFSNEFILGASIVSFLREHENTLDSISEEEVNLQVNKTFGNVTYAHDSGYVVSPNLCSFLYDKNARRYSLTKNCNFNPNNFVKRKLTQASKSDTEYILKEKMIFVKKEIQEDETIKIRIYNDVFETKLLKEFMILDDLEFETSFIMDDYIEEASTYEYRFFFDGNSFVYKSIQKVS